MVASSTAGRCCTTPRCIRGADPIRQEVNGAAVFVLGICREISFDDTVVANVVAAEGFSDVVNDTVDILFVILKEFLEGRAEVGRVGSIGGIVGIAFEAAGEDLLFEAVEAGGNSLKVESPREGRGDGYLTVRRKGQLGKL